MNRMKHGEREGRRIMNVWHERERRATSRSDVSVEMLNFTARSNVAFHSKVFLRVSPSISRSSVAQALAD
jgi:hypothetical protein